MVPCSEFCVEMKKTFLLLFLGEFETFSQITVSSKWSGSLDNDFKRSLGEFLFHTCFFLTKMYQRATENKVQDVAKVWKFLNNFPEIQNELFPKIKKKLKKRKIIEQLIKLLIFVWRYIKRTPFFDVNIKMSVRFFYTP